MINEKNFGIMLSPGGLPMEYGMRVFAIGNYTTEMMHSMGMATSGG
jgi:hypothetical protein